MALDRQTILGSPLHLEKVQAPEWARHAAENGEAHVYVRELSGEEVERLVTNAEDLPEREALARFCVLGVCDEGGNLLFSDEDLLPLMRGPLGPLRRCAEVFVRLNGLDVSMEDEVRN